MISAVGPEPPSLSHPSSKVHTQKSRAHIYSAVKSGAEVEIICHGCGQHSFQPYTEDVNGSNGERGREDFQGKRHKEGVTVA